MKIVYQKYSVLILCITALLFSGCSSDDDNGTTLQLDPFVVAFESLSTNLLDIDNQTNIGLVYSRTTTVAGSVTIQINPENAVYGVDFTTVPAAVNNTITLSIANGEVQNAIQFNKLNEGLDETTEIEFTITAIDYANSEIQGNSIFLINSSAALGGSISPEVGGPNEGNQVYVDLSSESAVLAQRDSWDLGFYNGNEFRVALNGSIYMATAALTEIDIDAVTEADVSGLQAEVAVGTFNPINTAYVDAPNGNILETAINEVSDTDSENPVYLLNLGYEVGTATATVGSVEIAGNHRGWKKIRILKTGSDYVLQYADLNDTSHQEITISKNSTYNFNHFSFNTNTLVDVEPQKEKWDICFSVFTNVLPGAGSYGFSDFVFHNRKGNVKSYKVETADFAYDDFALANVIESNFLEDQTTIGSDWRSVFDGGSVSDDRFYIIKDSNDNLYKLKFLGLTNNTGERGYPEFQYKLLQ